MGECLYNYWTDLLDWVLSYWVQLTPTWNKSLNSLLQLLIIASVLSVITSTVKNKKIFFMSNINRLKHFFIKWYAWSTELVYLRHWTGTSFGLTLLRTWSTPDHQISGRRPPLSSSCPASPRTLEYGSACHWSACTDQGQIKFS